MPLAVSDLSYRSRPSSSVDFHQSQGWSQSEI